MKKRVSEWGGSIELSQYQYRDRSQSNAGQQHNVGRGGVTNQLAGYQANVRREPGDGQKRICVEGQKMQWNRRKKTGWIKAKDKEDWARQGLWLFSAIKGRGAGNKGWNKPGDNCGCLADLVDRIGGKCRRNTTVNSAARTDRGCKRTECVIGKPVTKAAASEANYGICDEMQRATPVQTQRYGGWKSTRDRYCWWRWTCRRN